MKLRYKNYIGSYKYYKEDKEYHGNIVGIRDIVHFCAKNLEDLKKAFEESVEDYLEMCTENNMIPEKSCSGDLRIRTTPEVHQKLLRKAQFKGMSLNAYLNDQLNSLINKTEISNKKK